LRATAKLDPSSGIPLAIAALSDSAPSVRAAAVDILEAHARHVDFDEVSRRLQDLSDPHARRAVLPVFMQAPKWEAALHLLEAVGDAAPEVRRKASQLLDRWTADFNRSQAQPTSLQLERIRSLLGANAAEMSVDTAALLRFSVTGP
jgi:hypothetical protein